MQGNLHVRFGGGRREKDAVGCPSLPTHYGLTNPDTSRTSPAAYPTPCWPIPPACWSWRSFSADRPGSLDELSELVGKHEGRIVAARIHAYAPNLPPPFGKPEVTSLPAEDQ